MIFDRVRATIQLEKPPVHSVPEIKKGKPVESILNIHALKSKACEISAIARNPLAKMIIPTYLPDGIVQAINLFTKLISIP